MGLKQHKLDPDHILKYVTNTWQILSCSFFRIRMYLRGSQVDATVMGYVKLRMEFICTSTRVPGVGLGSVSVTFCTPSPVTITDPDRRSLPTSPNQYSTVYSTVALSGVKEALTDDVDTGSTSTVRNSMSPWPKQPAQADSACMAEYIHTQKVISVRTVEVCMHGRTLLTAHMYVIRWGIEQSGVQYVPCCRVAVRHEWINNHIVQQESYAMWSDNSPFQTNLERLRTLGVAIDMILRSRCEVSRFKCYGYIGSASRITCLAFRLGKMEGRVVWPRETNKQGDVGSTSGARRIWLSPEHHCDYIHHSHFHTLRLLGHTGLRLARRRWLTSGHTQYETRPARHR